MLKELEPLFAQYTRSRETLYKTIESLDGEQLEECLPERDWSIKDTLVHIATNEVLMTQLLKDIANGTSSALPADFDNQHFNDEQVALGHEKSIEQIRAELDSSFANLEAVLDSITPDQLGRRGVHPAAGDTDVKEFFLAMYAHHEVHTRDVVEQARRLRRAENA
ncbi:MAG TPA: DinB family protein [Anaerolineae bacterium]|nr:DinB family protein [Anaerolineae bacterium]